MILVDTNVVIDAFDPDAENHEWAFRSLTDAVAQGAFLNYIVAAELSARSPSQEALAEMLAALRLPIEQTDLAIAFRAGRAFGAWIDRGGRRGALLPDFLIGAHAAIRGAAILTQDVRRFRRYFPEVTLITPETHP